MFREIRGIEDETILSAIHRLPAYYFQGGWADEIRVDFFGLPAGGEELGFFTAEMKEKDFNAKCGELGTAVLSRIRLL